LQKPSSNKDIRLRKGPSPNTSVDPRVARQIDG